MNPPHEVLGRAAILLDPERFDATFFDVVLDAGADQVVMVAAGGDGGADMVAFVDLHRPPRLVVVSHHDALRDPAVQLTMLTALHAALLAHTSHPLIWRYLLTSHRNPHLIGRWPYTVAPWLIAAATISATTGPGTATDQTNTEEALWTVVQAVLAHPALFCVLWELVTLLETTCRPRPETNPIQKGSQ